MNGALGSLMNHKNVVHESLVVEEIVTVLFDDGVFKCTEVDVC